jgi:hypothetical protein
LIEDIKLIERTLDYLIELLNAENPLFYKEYKTLPFNLYKEIERLSVSKSVIYNDVCSKSKLVADSFHKNIK